MLMPCRSGSGSGIQAGQPGLDELPADSHGQDGAPSVAGSAVGTDAGCPDSPPFVKNIWPGPDLGKGEASRILGAAKTTGKRGLRPLSYGVPAFGSAYVETPGILRDIELDCPVLGPWDSAEAVQERQLYTLIPVGGRRSAGRSSAGSALAVGGPSPLAAGRIARAPAQPGARGRGAVAGH